MIRRTASDRVLVPDVDHIIGAQLSAQLQSGMRGSAREDYRVSAQRLADRDCHQSDWAGTGNQQAFPGNQSAERVQPVHGRSLRSQST